MTTTMERLKISIERLSEKELVCLRDNLIKSEKVEEALFVNENLTQRFPYKRLCGTPIFARFHDREMIFISAAKAFVWMLENFLEEFGDKFIYLVNIRHSIISYGRKIRYLSYDLNDLFPGSPKLKEKPWNYTRLRNGIYVRTLSDTKKKERILHEFSYTLGLEWNEDCSWTILE